MKFILFFILGSICFNSYSSCRNTTENRKRLIKDFLELSNIEFKNCKIRLVLNKKENSFFGEVSIYDSNYDHAAYFPIFLVDKKIRNQKCSFKYGNHYSRYFFQDKNKDEVFGKLQEFDIEIQRDWDEGKRINYAEFRWLSELDPMKKNKFNSKNGNKSRHINCHLKKSLKTRGS